MNTSIIRIEAVPLTASNFADFGAVLGVALDAGFPGAATELGTGTAINDATGQRFDHPSPLDLNRFDGEPLLALFKTEGDAHRAPFRLRGLERHQRGSQSFAPLGSSRCLAIVTKGDTQPDLASIQAYIVEPGQVVTLHAAVWHHPLLTIGAATVLVLERHAIQVDCEFYPITNQIDVTLPG